MHIEGLLKCTHKCLSNVKDKGMHIEGLSLDFNLWNDILIEMKSLSK